MTGTTDDEPAALDPEVWRQAPTLEAVSGAAAPDLISDGGGLPFHPDRLTAPTPALDATDPAVQALLTQIDAGRRQAQPARLFRPRAKPVPIDTAEKLLGWRELARTDAEALFGRGLPPRLLTVAVKRGRRNRWSPLGASNARPLRAVRHGARASSWRLDPGFVPGPDDLEVRVLLTEQTMASGTPAVDRLLEPELYLGADQAVLRLYVRPLAGYVGRTAKRETPVIVRLPVPLGDRRLVDGALYEPPRS
jgi:hypothetical protein